MSATYMMCRSSFFEVEIVLFNAMCLLPAVSKMFWAGELACDFRVLMLDLRKLRPTRRIATP